MTRLLFQQGEEQDILTQTHFQTEPLLCIFLKLSRCMLHDVLQIFLSPLLTACKMETVNPKIPGKPVDFLDRQ